MKCTPNLALLTALGMWRDRFGSLLSRWRLPFPLSIILFFSISQGELSALQDGGTAALSPPPHGDVGNGNSEANTAEGDTAELMERLASAAPTFHSRKGKKKAGPTVGESEPEAKRSKTVPAARGAPPDDDRDPWKEFQQDGYHGFANNNDDLDSFMAHTILPGAVATGDEHAGRQPRETPTASVSLAAKVPGTQAAILKQGPADMPSLARYIGEKNNLHSFPYP